MNRNSKISAENSEQVSTQYPSVLRVLHVTVYEGGGAGRAAKRIALATEIVPGLRIQNMFFYSQPERGLSGALRILAKQVIRIVSRGLFHSGTSDLHSVAALRTRLPAWINKKDVDLVHLHWLGDSALAVEEVPLISAPLVWTMHDMWPFCGAEHYTDTTRHRKGYTRDNRPAIERGPDINRWVWARKARNWWMPIYAVAPSKWLADSARASAIGREWNVRTIPYPVDVDFWSPGNREEARSELGIGDDEIFLVFVAEKGLSDERKGGPDVISVTQKLSNLMSNRRIVLGVAGQRADIPDTGNVEVRQFGLLEKDVQIRLLYRAADFSLVPSRRDNFPLSVAESLACAVPVAAYDSTGAAEMIERGSRGVLAEPGDFVALARGIAEMLDRPQAKIDEMKHSARQYAVQNWAPEKIGKQYADLYLEVLKSR